ncbi:DUF4351 domain-containing protein [Nocardia vaccinii]|uniref:DUF4351 domain-containing protein n=1 Tax=Nocardia vaccinii TaxID=1822 RepID=UPI00082AA773|nr:DUF4351 domain-containing protein [Nocardia vaccinii]
MTTGDMLRLEGIAEGRTEERATVVLELLTTKFGDISETVRHSVRNAPLADLTTWTTRILTAETIDAIFA